VAQESLFAGSLAWTNVALGIGLEGTYLFAVTLFQLALAGLILSVGDRRAERWAFGLVVLLGGTTTLRYILEGVTGVQAPALLGPAVDTFLLWTLAFLAAQLPTPLGGRAGRRWALRAWLGGGAVLALLPSVVAALPGTGSGLADRLVGDFRWLAFMATPLVASVHTIPRWTRLDDGPLRWQTLLAGAGLLLSPLFIAAEHTVFSVSGLGDLVPGRTAPEVGFRLGLAWFSLVCVARLVVAAVRRVPGAGWFLGLVGLGVAASYLRGAPGFQRPPELAAHILRPLLFAAAMLRYDLFRVPDRVRGLAVPTAAVAGLALAFLFGAVVLTPESAADDRLDPMVSVLLVAGLGAAVVARAPLLDAVGRDRGDERTRALERYRLALERRADAEGPGATPLEGLRQELGLSLEDHAALLGALEAPAEASLAQARPAEPGDVVGGRYTVERELGAGGHGRALLAWDEREDRPVVLKAVVNPWEEAAEARRGRLEHELGVARRVDDAPGLATVHGLEHEGPRVYLVREYVPGPTLDEVVEEGPLDPHRAAEVVEAVAASVGRLHEEDLLHLDLKPGNIVLPEGGPPVVIDYGTVQAVDRGDGDRTATVGPTGPAVGTLAWMAPEQCLEDAVDERTDVFALGALAYFLATGRKHVPVEDRSRFEVEDAIVHGTPPTDAPEPVRAALARDPDRRPGSAAALAGALHG